MERVVKGRSFTLSKTFYSDGVAQTPGGMPTVAITRVSDGTTVATSSVSGTGTGPYLVTVTAANNTLLDTLTVTWTALVNSQSNTYTDTVEVAGDTLFSIAQGLALVSTATAGQIADARTYAETELEKALGYAVVPRYASEKRQGRWYQALRVRNPYPRAIRSATVNGVTLTAPQLALLSFDANGFVVGYGWGTDWTGTLNNVTIGYEHGLDTPPPGANRAALAVATEYLGGGAGSVDPRAERLITDDGTLVFGSAGSGVFRAPGVNEWVNANRLALVA